MTRLTNHWLLRGTLCVFAITLLTSLASAGGLFVGGNFGGGSQTSARQMLLPRVQQTVGFDNDEWTVVEPKLWRIVQLQLQTGHGSAGLALQRFDGRFGRSGRQAFDLATILGADADPIILQQGNELRRCENELLTVLNDPNTSDNSILEKLTAYRQTRQELVAELAEAQQDLQNVLTLRQEALLVQQGFLP